MSDNSTVNVTIANSTIADNNTSVNTDCYTSSFFCDSTEDIGAIFLIFSTLTFIIGIVSWRKIHKFRHFKNFLLLNIILNNNLNIVLSVLFHHVPASNAVLNIIHGLLYIYFKLTINFWLLVLCYVVYIESVKVFKCTVKRKYLKSNIFAWGTPAFIIIFNIFVLRYVDRTNSVTTALSLAVLFFPLTINLVIYIKVLIALLEAKVHNGKDIRRRIEIATVIFLVSGILFLLMALRILLSFPLYVSVVLLYLQPSVALVYFLGLRLNRDIWVEHYNRKKRIKTAQTVIDLSMKNRRMTV